MDRSSKQNIKKDIVSLNNTLDEMDLTNIYIERETERKRDRETETERNRESAFHPKEAKHTFFSRVHVTFSNIDHIIGHKASLNKFKKIEII